MCQVLTSNLCSNYTEKITLYQEQPQPYKPAIRRNGRYVKLWLWTDTIEGYKNEAERLVQTILENDRLQPANYWFVSINYHEYLTPKEIKTRWQKATRNLRLNQIVAIWIIEPTRKNYVHYHLLVKDANYTEASLRQIIKSSIKSKHTLNVQKLGENQLHKVARYMTKAKRAGFNEAGESVNDKYASKRLLFKKKLGIKKYSIIGKFWTNPVFEIRKSIKQREIDIFDAMEQPEVIEQVRQTEQLVGTNYTKKQLKRMYAVQWIQEQKEKPEIK